LSKSFSSGSSSSSSSSSVDPKTGCASTRCPKDDSLAGKSDSRTAVEDLEMGSDYQEEDI
jgi:hypothetical protein